MKSHLLLLAGLLVGTLSCALPSQAATYTVFSLDDSGPGTLRGAIAQANLTPESDVIDFQPGLQGAITLASQISITGGVQIKGPGASQLTITAVENSRTLTFISGASTLSDVTIANTNNPYLAPVSNVSTDGLTITKCVWRGNIVRGGSSGGALYNSGHLSVSGCSFENNQSNRGGAIYNTGTLSLESSTFDSNTALAYTKPATRGSDGRGSGGRPGSIIPAAYFPGHGGALCNGFGTFKGTAVVTNCTFHNNTTTGERTSTTIDYGSDRHSGGALFNDSDSTLSLVNCTFSGNTDTTTGTEIEARIGTLVNIGTLSSRNTVFVADVQRPFFGFFLPPLSGDANKNFAFASNALAGLGVLQFNGGPVKTMALASRSPLIDAGLVAGSPATDARGEKRPQGKAPDVGAYEAPAPPLPVLSVNAPSVREGNGGTATPSQLVFTLSLSKASATPVSVFVQSANASTASATARYDYVPLGKTRVIFAPGQTRQTVALTIVGDTICENNERVALALGLPVGMTLAAVSAEGTIVNDDALPYISINDVSAPEGSNPRAYTKVVFTVSLSNPSDRPITVGYTTYGSGRGVATGGTPSTANVDYIASAGTLTFSPGQTSKTLVIYIKGDTLVEGNEIFGVRLSAPVNARIADGIGIGTILNDDGSTTSTALTADSPSAGAS